MMLRQESRLGRGPLLARIAPQNQKNFGLSEVLTRLTSVVLTGRAAAPYSIGYLKEVPDEHGDDCTAKPL